MHRCAIAATIAIAVAILTGCDGPPPTDSQLAILFAGQRTTFEQLRDAMCTIAPQTVWASDGTFSADDGVIYQKVPPAKLAIIGSLMTKIGATRAASLAPETEKNRTSLPCDVEIMVWSTGMLDSGDSRAFEYALRPGPRELEVPSLENVDIRATVEIYDKASHHAHRSYRKHLEGSWWLTRDYWE